MAIAFDSAQANQGTGNPYTWSHTSTGSNLVGLVSLQAVSGDTVTAASWGGVSMTLSNKQNRGGGRFDYLFIIVGQATGSQTISITNTEAVAIKGRSVSYTGCSQTSQPNVANKATVVATNPLTVSLVTTVDGCWLVGEIDTAAGGTLTGGTNTVARQTVDDATFWDSNASVGSAGSYSLSWTGSVAITGGGIGVGIAPTSSGPANLKTYNTNAKANIKSIDTNLIANVKTLNTNA